MGLLYILPCHVRALIVYLRLLLILPLLALMILLTGCNVESSTAIETYHQQVLPLTVEQLGELPVSRRFSGLIKTTQRSDLGFELGGKLAQLNMHEGDRVEAGQVLAALDTTLLSIERRELQAQKAEAKASLKLVKANLERQRTLEKDGYASKQRRDELLAEKGVLEASLQRLNASLEANSIRVEKSHLKAPFSGVISERYFEAGTVVATGTPVFRLIQTDVLEAHIGVPKAMARQLELGSLQKVYVGGVGRQATVIGIGSDLKAGTHTATVRLQLGSKTEFFPGDLVELELSDSIKQAGYYIPLSSLTEGLRGLWNVYALVLDEPTGLYRLETRDVQINYADDNKVYVQGALESGDQIVASGLHRLVPGQLVRRKDETVSAELHGEG